MTRKNSEKFVKPIEVCTWKIVEEDETILLQNGKPLLWWGRLSLDSIFYLPCRKYVSGLSIPNDNVKYNVRMTRISMISEQSWVYRKTEVGKQKIL